MSSAVSVLKTVWNDGASFQNAAVISSAAPIARSESTCFQTIPAVSGLMWEPCPARMRAVVTSSSQNKDGGCGKLETSPPTPLSTKWRGGVEQSEAGVRFEKAISVPLKFGGHGNVVFQQQTEIVGTRHRRVRSPQLHDEPDGGMVVGTGYILSVPLKSVGQDNAIF